ncbi:MAG: hypothetical protein M1305_07115, partial [Candidatus Marsarchaeota archaeon]|nr:hypothetical protein [Candidatus Marsarchaeota archaeon]
CYIVVQCVFALPSFSLFRWPEGVTEPFRLQFCAVSIGDSCLCWLIVSPKPLLALPTHSESDAPGIAQRLGSIATRIV